MPESEGFTKMRVGILGSGDVGRALGRGLAAAGHSVKIGTRTPDSEPLEKWKGEVGKNGSVGSFAQAAEHGELVVLAVRGDAIDAVLDLAGAKTIGRKVVIDTTNPLDFSKGMPPGLFVGRDDSLGERVQHKLPQARVVKCFNIVPNSMMTAPKVAGGVAEMMICGNDAAAKKEVEALLQGLGWPAAIDIGPIEGSRWLEALVPLWVRVGAAIGTFNFAFRTVRG